MMAKLNWMVVFLMVAVWVSGCSTQAPTDLGGFTQEMVPRESKTCSQMRDNLEMMFFDTYKGSIPRRLLKQVLPGLVEPLMPPECTLRGSQGKWLLETTARVDQSPKRVERQIGGYYTSPLTNIKDPGDHHPPGMLRDPMKDPGDLPGGITFHNPWTPPARSGAHDPYAKPLRGRFYGDQLPPRRRKRSAEEEDSKSDAALVRHKRANGEEEKKGPNFDPLGFSLFGDHPDHRAAAPTFPFFSPFFSSFRRLFFPQRSASVAQRARANAARRQNEYGPRPNVFYGDAPSYRGNAAVRSQAPVAQPGPVLAPAMAQPAARVPVAAPPPAPAPSPVIQSPANQAAAPRSNLLQPAAGPALGTPPATAPASGFASFIPAYTSRASHPSSFKLLPTAPLQPAVPGNGGVVYGDTLPGYSTTSNRRVKRASDNNNSPSDMVTFGDFSMPADTFHKLISPRSHSNSDDSGDRHGARRSYAPPPRPPPPRIYNHVARPPVYYNPGPAVRRTVPMYNRGYPFPSTPARARQAYLLNARRRALAMQANQVRQARQNAPAPAARASPYTQAGLAPQAPTPGMMPTFPQPLPLPMGAARPIYGNHPAY